MITKPMKRLTILCGIIAALLCLAQNASAQYARKGAKLVDPNRTVLTDQQIIGIVGQDIYDQTVVGARKQYKAGTGLLWGGIGGVVVGTGLAAYPVLQLVNNTKSVEEAIEALADEPGGLAMYAGGCALAGIGSTLFTIGVIMKCVGKGRLSWVAEQANAAKGYSLCFGPTPHGVGVSLSF